MAKNTQRIAVLLGFSNLLHRGALRRRLMRGQSARDRRKAGEWAAGESRFLFLDTKTQFR